MIQFAVGNNVLLIIVSGSLSIGAILRFLNAKTILAIGVALLATELQAAETTPDLPHYEEVDCGEELEFVRGVTCGRFTTLENRTSGSVRVVEIPVVVFASEGEKKHADPVVLVSGGPGSAPLFSRLEILNKWPDFVRYTDWLADRDLILFDQRGSGLARPSLDCTEERERIEDAPLLTHPIQALRDCAERLRGAGVDLSAYHTPALAADLNELRRAMGVEAWNIWAHSYGARVALEAIRQDEAGVRSVILVAPKPLSGTDPLTIVRNFDRILSDLFAGCQRHDICQQMAADLPAMFKSLLEDLKTSPREISVLSTSSYRVKTYEVDDRAFLRLLFNMSYRQGGLGGLPFAIVEAHRGDFQFRPVALDDVVGLSPHISIGAYAQIKCNDAPTESLRNLETAMARYPYLAGWADAVFHDDFCEAWNVPDEPALDPNMVESDLPVLILAGAYDPVIPVAWAHEIAEHLPNGQLFVFPGAAHDVGNTVCSERIIARFLEAPERRPSDPCFLYQSGPTPDP